MTEDPGAPGAGAEALANLANPILNSPYEVPSRHFELASKGPTGRILGGRRESLSFIPVPTSKKARQQQAELFDSPEFAAFNEAKREHTLINELRKDVARWRLRGYEGARPVTKMLLEHWSDPDRENRVLFAQREAAETAIYLYEVGARAKARDLGYRDWRDSLTGPNQEHNARLPRVALKMATGAGKTVVMAMLIAWQTLNQVNSRGARRGDSQYTKRFLIVTPGITIRDRLRVLQPNADDNYYDARGIVPPTLRRELHRAEVKVVNYHQFLLRDRREFRGVAKKTKEILAGSEDISQFQETEDDMVTRVLRDWARPKSPQIMVLNDEAHHCYQDAPREVPGELADGEAAERNQEARVWFKGLQAIHTKLGIKNIVDLSATPYYLKGSGYKEGDIFPWVVSDFSLMDAIESGIVKVPRLPVDDDAETDTVTYLNLWEQIKNDMPASRGKNKVESAADWTPPDVLLGAMDSLYRSYEREFRQWEALPADRRGTPPVFIVVCNNMAVSKLVYELIGGFETHDDDGVSTGWNPGRYELFSNIEHDVPKGRPTSILVDSAQMESGEQLSRTFKEVAAPEIEAFKQDLHRRNPGRADVEITDEDLLREVMNTVGKPGMLGEQVRCVVSVSMLTEGWDANTVTHILGLRAFGSQLLCEQVVGRGLRRRSYEVNEAGHFNPEYANVYGVPFQFIPSDRPVPPVEPPKPTTRVYSVPGRQEHRIRFPRVTGYRWEQPDDDLLYLPDDVDEFRIGPHTFPGRTETAGLVGESEQDELPEQPDARTQAVAFSLTKELMNRHFKNDDAGIRPWLFPRLLKLTKEWISRAVVVEDGWSLSMLGEGTSEDPRRFDQTRAQAAQELNNAINRTANARRWVRPLLAQFAPVGSTAEVDFRTSRQAVHTEKSEVSHVVLSSGGGESGGNTWEQILTLEAERHPQVVAYVKNENLGFEIPYLLDGLSYHFEPDFLLRLKRADGSDADRTLVVETSGSLKREKQHRKTEQKTADARKWVAAVNNHGGFGRWGFIEITDITHARESLDAAIDRLYADAPDDEITGELTAKLT